MEKKSRSPFAVMCLAFAFGVIALVTNLAVSFFYPRLFFWAGIQNEPEWIQSLMDIAVYLALLLPGALFLWLVFRENPAEEWRQTPGSPRLPFLFLPMALGAGYLVSLLGDYVCGDFLERFSQSSSAESYYTEPGAVALYFVSTCILAPLLEEYIYRGLLFKHLLPLGEGVAVFVTSLLFGLCHLSLSQTLFAFAVGISLGYARSRTGSIWFGVLIHFVTNLISFAVTYWAFVFEADWVEPVWTVVYTYLINAAIAGVAVYIILRIIRKAKQRSLFRGLQIEKPKSNVKWIFANPFIYLFLFGYAALLFIYYHG